MISTSPRLPHAHTIDFREQRQSLHDESAMSPYMHQLACIALQVVQVAGRRLLQPNCWGLQALEEPPYTSLELPVEARCRARPVPLVCGRVAHKLEAGHVAEVHRETKPWLTV